jgi:hypothetical protein
MNRNLRPLRLMSFALIAVLAIGGSPRLATSAERGGEWRGEGPHGTGGSWHRGGVWRGNAGAWHGGRWFRGWYGGRFGWWWYVPGYDWYAYYDEPVYPYPAYPYAGSPNLWYYCEDPAGYYPYIQQCTGPWQPVQAPG